MAQNMMRNRLINFSDLSGSSEEQKNCHREAFNSIMIKISDLDQYEEAQDFIHCEKEDCKMVLTNQDKDYIDDWNWVSSNQEHYSDIKDKIQKMKQNKWNYYIWNCRFCATKNLVSKDKIYFASNRSKVILKDIVKSEKTQTKVNDSPLLLFLIDNSNSMEEEIPDLNDDAKIKSNKELNYVINEVLRKTQIYQKISENQKKILNQLVKKIDPGQKKIPAYVDSLTKYKVLMGITQKVVNQICEGKNKHQSYKISISCEKAPQRKIGFMFFNSDVILQKIPKKNETKVIKISDKQFEADHSKEGHLKVDFNNLNDLYHIGKNNSQNYGMDINQFRFSDIQLSNVIPSGQTALGPALAIASGIVNGYGSGSLIVVITDGKANKGIFSQEGLEQEQIKLLRLRIDKARAEVCLIKLDNKNQSKQPQIQSTLQRYFRKYATTINVSLFQKQPLQQLRKKLFATIQRSISSKTWTNDIKIKCQNPNIKYENNLQKMKKKLFKEHQTEFASPQIDEQKFTAFDYRHPFMTQILIFYQNIETKQQSKFMAYIMQKLIRYSEMSKKDEQAFNSIETLRNVLKYLEVEGEKLDMNNIPLSLCQQSFRTFIMESYKHSEKRENKEIMISMYQQSKEKNVKKTPKEMISQLVERNELNQEDDQSMKL